MDNKKDIWLFLGVILAVIIVAFIQPGFTPVKTSAPVLYHQEAQSTEIQNASKNIQVVFEPTNLK